MKVRHNLARRMNAAAACAKLDAAWWRDFFGRPYAEVRMQPLRGRAIWTAP